MNVFGSLSMGAVKERLHQEGVAVEAWLDGCLDAPDIPAGLRASMEYSLMAGGKRLRPVLCLVSARLHGLGGASVMPFAGALECIHTYSLIHDDLPAMDNDDLRRGKPSNHKQFDEATAILAGDGLLTDAFAFMASAPDIAPERKLEALALVASSAGSSGMVGGQFLDMYYTARQDIDIAGLAAMHGMKTGALLTAPCVAGAILAGATPAEKQAMRMYGRALGAAFQIMDDILDATGDQAALGKPVGSDAAMGKNTYVSLLGLEGSRALAGEKAMEAASALAPYSGMDADFLRGLAGYVVNRVT